MDIAIAISFGKGDVINGDEDAVTGRHVATLWYILYQVRSDAHVRTG